MNKYSIIIPCYNECSRGNLFYNIREVLHNASFYFKDFEIIIVDDCSNDNTFDNLKNEFSDEKSIRILKNNINRGKGYSIRNGIKHSDGNYIIYMDADLSVPLYYFREFRDISDDNICIIASRHLKESQIMNKDISTIRKLGTSMSILLLKYMYHLNVSDSQCGFKMFYIDDKFDADSFVTDRWLFDIELLLYLKKLGYKITEFPVIWNNNTNSTLNPSNALGTSLIEIKKINEKLREEK